MNIGEAFSFIEYLSNKAGNGGYIPPSERTMLAQRAELEFLSKYYNNVKQYVRGDKTPLYGYADTKRVYDNLDPYLKTVILTLDQNGDATNIPSDYLHTIGFFSTYTQTKVVEVPSLDCGDDRETKTVTTITYPPIKELDPDKFGYRVNSVTKPPTLEYPIAKFMGGGITVMPTNTSLPKLDYIRKPKGAIYNYTQVGNSKPVFNPIGSVDWEAPEDCHNELCQMVLQYVGIHVSGDMIMQWAKYKEDTGI